VGQKIWKLEANFDRNKVGVSLSQKDEYEDVIKHKLKKAMELVGTLDTLGEEIMRLKFTMEAMPAAGSEAAMKFVSAAGAQEGAAGAADASRVNFTSATGAMLSRLLDSTASPQAPQSAAPSSCRGGSSSAAVRHFRDTSCRIADNVSEWLCKHSTSPWSRHQSSSSQEAEAQPSPEHPILSFCSQG
jgi:hypothetical protein